MKSSKMAWMVLMVMVARLASAADEVPSSVKDNFDPKIDSWAEGTVMTLDADGAKFVIRGSKRPYASAYAKMRKEIHDKTATLNAADGVKKANEIRTAWQPELEKTRTAAAAKDADFTFHLPSADQSFVYFEESMYYNRVLKFEDKANTTVALTEVERNAMKHLKDLHIGDFIVVGYQNGVIYSDAYVVIKANKELGQIAR